LHAHHSALPLSRTDFDPSCNCELIAIEIDGGWRLAEIRV
jgi:hypothetical protein